MKILSGRACGLWLSAAAVLILLPAVVVAVEHHNKAAADAVTVDLFEGIANKQIDVKFIPKDSTQAKVMIANKTDKPLSVKLPAAFAAVPVLGQAAARQPAAGGNNNNAAQAMGGGMMGGGMMGGGMGGGGMGGGFFNVPPEKVGQFNVAGVCLEHGRPEPRAAIPYEVRPIESFTDKAPVQEVLKMLGTGTVNQRAAQVAVWHLQNNMSFETLAAKRLRFANGTSQPYFSPEELQAGMQVIGVAVKAAEERQKQSGSQSTSLSQN